MEPIDPRVPAKLIPLDARAQVIDHAYKNEEPLPSVVTPRGLVISRWTLTEFERERIAAGEDIFLTMWAAGIVNPVSISVGMVNWNDERGGGPLDFGAIDPWDPGPPR